MTGICGWTRYVTTPEKAQEIIARMAEVLPSGHASLRSCGTDWGLASRTRRQDFWHCHGDIAIAVCGHPFWRHQGLQAEQEKYGLATSLATAFRDMGHKLLAHLGGDFSLAIVDNAARKTLLAIDRMGHHALAHAQVGEALLFGSSCDAMLRHPAADPDINLQGIFNYLYFHVLPADNTVYHGWRRLLPGHYLLMCEDSLDIKPYWRMQFQEQVQTDYPQLRTEFLTLLESCVKRAAADAATGTFLSGGTDSSTVTGMLARAQGEPVDCYSIGFDVNGYDETEFATIAARHFGARHHVYTLTPDDVARAIPLVADSYDQPYGNSSAVPTYYCARIAAADGVQRLLGGDGGDELFGGNARYAKQQVFDRYNHIPVWLRKSVLEPLLMNLPGGNHIPVIAKARRYVHQANIPMPLRMEGYNLMRYMGVENLLTPDFLARVDEQAPDRLLSKLYDGALAKSMINRMLALDFQITLADNDLPKVTRMCTAAGIDVGFPLLDDELVAFSARLSPDMKLRGTTLRYFFKRALSDFLPEEIINKRKHGFGLPFGAWVQEHNGLRELAGDSLAGIRSRGIVNQHLINRLLSDYLGNHSGYYGSLIWILMMLEQWFVRRAPGWSL